MALIAPIPQLYDTMVPLRRFDYPGLLIAYEGIDGCGKGTQLKLTVDAIAREGWGDRVVVSKTPGGTKFGDALRDVLFQSVTTRDLEPESASLLYFISHLETWANIVRPALEAGKIVLTDRWDAFSGVTYGVHGGVRSIHPFFLEMRQLFSGPEPDLAFLFKGDPSVFLDRAQKRRTEDHQQGKIWNDLAKQRIIQVAYEHLFVSDNRVVIQADEGSQEEVFKHTWNHVYGAIRKKFDLT